MLHDRDKEYQQTIQKGTDVSLMEPRKTHISTIEVFNMMRHKKEVVSMSNDKKKYNMIKITKKVCSAETHVKTSQRNKNIHFKNVNACELFQDDVE